MLVSCWSGRLVTYEVPEPRQTGLTHLTVKEVSSFSTAQRVLGLSACYICNE